MSRVVPEFAYGVSVLAHHNTNKVGQIKVHHATGLFRSRTTMRRSCPYFDASFAQEAGLMWRIRVPGNCHPAVDLYSVIMDSGTTSLE